MWRRFGARAALMPKYMSARVCVCSEMCAVGRRKYRNPLHTQRQRTDGLLHNMCKGFKICTEFI